MPLTQLKKINSSTLLGRWALTETIAELQAHPDLPAHLYLPETLKHEKRQLEWLASRILSYQMLQHFTAATYLLQNDANGRPFFQDSSYRISISHTLHQVAVLLSADYSVGIDIERVQPKIMRIQDKFLAPAEKLACDNDLIKLTVAWSAKETLYKLYGSKEIIFSQNLFLFPFDIALNNSLKAHIQTARHQQQYTVYFEVENETVLTYCTDNKYSTSK